MRDPAHKIMRATNSSSRQRKTRSAVKFIVKHTQPYYTITYRRQKLAAVEAVKSYKDGNGDWQQHA